MAGAAVGHPAPADSAASPLPRAAAPGLTADQCIRIAVASLKSARALGLLSAAELADADARLGGAHRWPLGGSLLASALLGEDEDLALDTLELICVSQKQTEPCAAAEMALLHAFVPLRLKGNQPDSRKRIANCLRRFFLRLLPPPLTLLLPSSYPPPTLLLPSSYPPPTLLLPSSYPPLTLLVSPLDR